MFSYPFMPPAVSLYEFNSHLFDDNHWILNETIFFLELLLLLFRISLICYSFITSLLLNPFKCLVILWLFNNLAWKAIFIGTGSSIAFLILLLLPVLCGSVFLKCPSFRAYWQGPNTSHTFLLFSCLVVSDSLWPHRLQHARLPCPSPSPGTCSNHVLWVGDAIQPSRPLSSPSPSAFSLSQHQDLF